MEKTFLKSVYNKTVTIDNQIKDEKIQYDINREAAKISVLWSGKIDKYEYLTGEKILLSNQKQIIEKANFTYSPVVKTLEKHTGTIDDQREKQIKAIQNQGQFKTIKKYTCNSKDSPLISKQNKYLTNSQMKGLKK